MGSTTRTAFIATLSPVYISEGRKEIEAAITVEEVYWFDANTVLLETGIPFSVAMAKVWKSSPIFVRHIQPVHTIIDYAYDMDDVVRGLQSLCNTCDEKPALQLRSIGSSATGYTLKDIHVALKNDISADITRITASTPIVSLTLHEATAYLGVSRRHENGNLWIGGARHYQMNESVVSRAEFKLEEAIELFDVPMKKNDIAVDLGAAPGGWTSVLRRKGMKVIAVDPAELDPRIAHDTGITHLKMTADTALLSITDADCVVNDMRMEPILSAKIMNTAASVLHTKGWGIMTLKLPQENPTSVIEEALKILSKNYQCVGIRQLFHNRHEATVFLVKK